MLLRHIDILKYHLTQVHFMAHVKGAIPSTLATIVYTLIAFTLLLTVVSFKSTTDQSVLAQNAGSTPPFEQFTSQQMAASTNTTCMLTPSLIELEGSPQEIQGPYFVDGMPNRSDIRSDSLDGLVQGIPLRLVFNVYGADDNENDGDGVCLPLVGAQVDIWHANPQGLYSGVEQDGTGGENFLRGYQDTDDNGTVRFITIYPGWYEGRAIHIHAKVRASEGLDEPFEWTSQFYLDDSTNEQVHTQPPYSNHGQPSLTNEDDVIYMGPSTDGLVQSSSGKRLMLNLTEDEQGYIGTFDIVVDAN